LAALLVLGTSCALGVGCELIAGVDRSLIPSGQADDAATDVTTTDAPGDVQTGDVRTDAPATPDGGADADATVPGDAGDATTGDAAGDAAGDADAAAASDAGDAGDGGADDGGDAGDATVSDASDGGGDAADDASDGATSDASDGGMTLNGCGPTEFAANDARDAGTPVITFPDDAGGNTYTPKCLRVGVNQTVTFSGPFASHPLQQFPEVDGGNPMPSRSMPLNSGTTMNYQFNQQGVFGYSCSVHEMGGMIGAIEVLP
jgi:plastocyanin